VFDPAKPVATRSASGKTLHALMPTMPLVLGGSADLTPSNNTHFEGAGFPEDAPTAAISATVSANTPWGRS
jgi:transketolase